MPDDKYGLSTMEEGETIRMKVGKGLIFLEGEEA